MEERSTIAAVATAPGRGGVAVVRVSGPDAFRVAERLTGRTPEPGRIAFSGIRASAGPGAGVIDSGVVLAFRAPRSYTGEDVVEFQCHGGFVTPKRILEATIAAGARLARRGEFTERAFLNGKLSLDQAQAVLDLIDARTPRAAEAAFEALSDGASGGGTRADVRALYDAALEISSTVEHALDIDEGELPDSFFTRLDAAFREFRGSLAREIRRIRERRLLRAGALVVLAGPPNAGKSSLMNALLRENRAIVSDVPGTTRDSIEEWMDLDGWPVRLVDTAGLRATDDQIEAEGVRRTEALLEKADIVLRLGGDASSVGNELAVLSKCDLIPPEVRAGKLAVSAKTGEGLDALRAALAARLERLADDSSAPEAEDELSRRLSVFLEVDARLRGADTRDLVLFGNLLRRVCENLGALFGAAYSDDLLARIFSRFCVGK